MTELCLHCGEHPPAQEGSLVCEDCRTEVLGLPSVWVLTGDREEGYRLVGYACSRFGIEPVQVHESAYPWILERLVPKVARLDEALPFPLEAKIFYLPLLGDLLDDAGAQAPVHQVGAVGGTDAARDAGQV